MITKKAKEREATKRLISVFHLLLSLVGKRGGNSHPQMESMVQKRQGTGPLEPHNSVSLGLGFMLARGNDAEAQLVKSLPGMNNGLGVIPGIQGNGSYASANPAEGRWRQEDPWACWPASLDKLETLGSEGDPV